MNRPHEFRYDHGERINGILDFGESRAIEDANVLIRLENSIQRQTQDVFAPVDALLPYMQD